jgi:hypothetical protein
VFTRRRDCDCAVWDRWRAGGNSLGSGDLVGGFGCATADRLQVRPGGEGFLLDGRAAGAGAALEVVLEARVMLVARGMLRQVLVDGELQVALAVAFVAACGKSVLDRAMVSLSRMLRRVRSRWGGW